MQEVTQDRFGVITFWTLSDKTDRAKLQELLRSTGLDVTIPERTPQAVAWIDDKNQVRSTNDDTRIVEEHQLEMNRLPSNNMAAVLTTVLSRLQGVALREHGGVYWVPQDSVEAWKDVAAAIEASGQDNAVYQVRTGLDGQAIRAIEAALAHEVEQDTRTIRDEIIGGDLGDRALENRKRQVEAIRLKVEHYESILGRQLENLKRLADQAVLEESATGLVQVGDVV